MNQKRTPAPPSPQASRIPAHGRSHHRGLYHPAERPVRQVAAHLANDRVNVAAVGVGGMGRANLQALSSQNIVALCDVDWNYVDTRFADIPSRSSRPAARAGATGARGSTRARGEQSTAGSCSAAASEGEALRPISARCWRSRRTSTPWWSPRPDHTHAVIAMAAMDLGKHVYVQKPLAWSVEECREARQKRDRTKTTDPDGQSGTLLRRRAHGRTNTSSPAPSARSPRCTCGPTGRSPTGRRAFRAPRRCRPIRRPALEHERRDDARRGSFGSYTPPDKLAWDLFLGPSRSVDYHPIYHPFNWRGWTDWGVVRHRRHGRASRSTRRSGRWISTCRRAFETVSTAVHHDKTYPVRVHHVHTNFRTRDRAQPWRNDLVTTAASRPPKPVEMGD
jgi:hypothetical protein